MATAWQQHGNSMGTASKRSHNQSTNQSTVAILAQGSRCSRRYCQRYCVLPWGSTAISAMADQHLGPWYLIPTAKVVACLTDGDFLLVRASDVTLVDCNYETITTSVTRPSTPYIYDDTASSAPQGSRCGPRRRRVAAAEAPLPPPSDPGSSTNNTHAPHPPPGPPPMILSRPQAGNGKFYFTMLHKWAGRSAGGYGRPAGLLGKGSWARWSHREISSVFDDVTLSSLVKRSIFDNYDDASTELSQRWITERNLNNYVSLVPRRPGMQAGATFTPATTPRANIRSHVGSSRRCRLKPQASRHASDKHYLAGKRRRSWSMARLPSRLAEPSRDRVAEMAGKGRGRRGRGPLRVAQCER